MLHTIPNPYQATKQQYIDHKRYFVPGVNQYTGTPTLTTIYAPEYDTGESGAKRSKFPMGHTGILEGTINLVTTSNTTTKSIPFVIYLTRRYQVDLLNDLPLFIYVPQFPVVAMPANTSIVLDTGTGMLSLRLAATYTDLDTDKSFISFIIRSTSPIDYASRL